MSDDLAADEREGLMLIGEMRAHLGMLPSNLRPVADALIGTMEVALERKFKDAATITQLRADLDAANERAEKAEAERTDLHDDAWWEAAFKRRTEYDAAEFQRRAETAEADAAALRAQVERMRAALEYIASATDLEGREPGMWAINRARAALAPDPAAVPGKEGE